MALVSTLSGQEFLPLKMEQDTPPAAPSVRDAFVKGRFQGSFRSFFMLTDNASGLTDYHAWAAGGGLRFSTASFKDFQFGLGGVFHFNLCSSDLSAKDPATGASNRYEIGLFDVENPKNRHDLDRLEELWLRYRWKSSRITFGKQILNTPFINGQDGRMRPTAEAGIWLESRLTNNFSLEGGWLWKISPRSTVRWYGIGKSIGLYPMGLNPDGTASGYAEQLSSNGIGLLGITGKLGSNARVQVWDQYVDNIFNTVFIQADYNQPLKKGHQLLLGIQATHQNVLADGGNSDVSKSYFPKNGRSNVFSAQAGWQRGPWQAIGAYTWITSDGRFLSPREWGREPFYTFMARERVEGSGDMQAFNGRVNWVNRHKTLRLGLSYGHFYLPDVRQTDLNKYAFPAFRQLNFDTRYAFGGFLQGLRAQFLLVYKGRIGATYGKDKLVINRVDMLQYNLIFNYTY